LVTPLRRLISARFRHLQSQRKITDEPGAPHVALHAFPLYVRSVRRPSFERNVVAFRSFHSEAHMNKVNLANYAFRKHLVAAGVPLPVIEQALDEAANTPIANEAQYGEAMDALIKRLQK
jgi:hypothetical protein